MRGDASARTVLGLLIRQRRLSLEEFAEQLESFSRDHREVGTLSVRHVQRLAAGQLTSEQLRPATVRLLERFLGRPVEELLARPDAPRSVPAAGGRGSARSARRVAASQEEWLTTRRAPGARGRELTELAAWLYPESERAPGGHVLAAPHWPLGEPVDLAAVELAWADDLPAHALPGTDALDDLLPLTDEGVRYADYSRAVRDLVRPRLLENRPSYRLTGVRAGGPAGFRLEFGLTTFFEVFNLKQLLAHEFKRAWLRSGGAIPRVGDLPLRAAVGSPFDPGAVLMSPGISTLTIRRGDAGEGPGFVLHERDGGKVADGGGLCHTMPAGEFQPSSGAPEDVRNDFSLWRNIMREYSEEFLGTPEHDGCDSRPIDYALDEPFARFEEARERGDFRVFHYGLVVEPLELGVQQLTVAVIAAPTYDRLFGDMVAVNDEGRVVARDGVKRVPFTSEAVDRLEPRLSASALTLLRMAWNDRRALLGD